MGIVLTSNQKWHYKTSAVELLINSLILQKIIRSSSGFDDEDWEIYEESLNHKSNEKQKKPQHRNMEVWTICTIYTASMLKFPFYKLYWPKGLCCDALSIVFHVVDNCLWTLLPLSLHCSLIKPLQELEIHESLVPFKKQHYSFMNDWITAFDRSKMAEIECVNPKEPPFLFSVLVLKLLHGLYTSGIVLSCC